MNKLFRNKTFLIVLCIIFTLIWLCGVLIAINKISKGVCIC